MLKGFCNDLSNRNIRKKQLFFRISVELYADTTIIQHKEYGFADI